MTKKTERSAGNPRPYASKTLPTPSNVLKSIVSPLNIWQLILVSSVVTAVILSFVVAYTDFSYSTSILGFGGAVATAALGVGVKTSSNGYTNEVPSINDVSRTKEYFRAASRLSIYSIIAPLLTLAMVIPAQVMLPPGGISRSTRFFIVVIVAVSYIASYVVVKALCSYSSEISSTSFSTPVEVSSLPEIVATVGFIASPLLVVGAILYNSSPIIYLSFEFTLIDTVVLVVGMTLLYVALMNRL